MTSTLKTTAATDLTLNALVDGQSADASDVLTPFEEAENEIDEARETVSVSANDTHVKHLEDALVGVTGNFAVTKTNSGADEKLQLNLDATGVTAGYVPTANGVGGWAWGAQAGGGAQPVDITVTAGEALALRDYVYVDLSTGTAFKVDTNASPIRCGAVRGFVTEAAGIANGATGSVRILGEVSGFAGLTAWGEVWASGTAGSYTQTKPNPTLGGGQVAVALIGVAVSTTAILVLPAHVQYLRRESLSNEATLTITHHSDAQGRLRRALAFVSTTASGTSHASYPNSNQDFGVDLRGPSGSGGTTTITASGNASPLGDNGTNDFLQAQSFQVTAGQLTQLTVRHDANSGSPTGTVTVEVRTDNAGDPNGTVLWTGTYTPTQSATNTIPVTNGPYLAASTTYWLVLKPTNDQASGNRWLLQVSSSSTYANGTRASSTDAGASWTLQASDIQCSITTSSISTRDKLAQSFGLSSTVEIDQVQLQLKKTGTPTGTMTLRIETDSGGSPSGTLAHASATVTVAESTLATSYDMIVFDFASTFSLAAGTYWIVLSTDRAQSNTNYVTWGVDASAPGYASGEMKRQVSSVWSSASADAIFDVLGPGTTFDEPCVVGRWSGGTRDLATRFDDGAGTNSNTNTTFKNTSGATLDVTCMVVLP